MNNLNAITIERETSDNMELLKSIHVEQLNQIVADHFSMVITDVKMHTSGNAYVYPLKTIGMYNLHFVFYGEYEVRVTLWVVAKEIKETFACPNCKKQIAHQKTDIWILKEDNPMYVCGNCGILFVRPANTTKD